MTTHYFAWLIGAIALMCESGAAQSPKPTPPSELKIEGPALPTVDSRLDFSKFQSAAAKDAAIFGLELPSDLPSVPETLGFATAKAPAPQLNASQPAQQNQPPAASTSQGSVPNKVASEQLTAPNLVALNSGLIPLPVVPKLPAFSEQLGQAPVAPSSLGSNSAPPVAINSPAIGQSGTKPADPASFPPLPTLDGPQFAMADAQLEAPIAGRPVTPIATTLTQPWWTEPETLAAGTQGAMNIELDQLIWMAMERSPYVRSLLIEPQILEARANATLGAFDPAPFINSLFSDTSLPVGNTLTTGGPERLNDNLWENSAGIKAKTQGGAQTELAQEMNLKDSNSLFFLPGQQADSKMVLRFTQPLMRGAGRTYNRSSFVVANLSTSESLLDVSTKMQQHAFTIASNYWELYYARANYQQCERGLERLIALRDQLAGRGDLDSLRSQLYRADAQISRQRSQQARSLAQVAASEAKLRAAVGAAEFVNDGGRDLIPITLPADWKPNLDIQSELGLALNCHPNILATHARIKAAKVRLQVAENELRPTLNLVMEGYARGLNGDYNVGSSFGDQFSQGAPSYSAGMTYQRPYRNVTAKAILREKRLEMQKLLFDLDNALLLVSSEVESEIAGAEAAYVELEASVRATLAAHAELEFLEARWGNAFLEPSQSGTSLLLDQLLNANVQLIQTENAWARAQADHMLALTRVRLASGTLLSITTPSAAALSGGAPADVSTAELSPSQPAPVQSGPSAP